MRNKDFWEMILNKIARALGLGLIVLRVVIVGARVARAAILFARDFLGL